MQLVFKGRFYIEFEIIYIDMQEVNSIIRHCIYFMWLHKWIFVSNVCLVTCEYQIAHCRYKIFPLRKTYEIHSDLLNSDCIPKHMSVVNE